MTDPFPRAMADLGVWAETNGVSVDEARQRFAQYGVLCGIASVPALRTGIVFKGGNALDFVWQPNRSTIDLDFRWIWPARRSMRPHSRSGNCLAKGFGWRRTVSASATRSFRPTGIPQAALDVYYLQGERRVRSAG